MRSIPATLAGMKLPNLHAAVWLWALLQIAARVCAQEAKVVEKEGRVIITKAGAKPAPAEVNTVLLARDRLGTGESSRAVLRMSDKWFARVDEETDVTITPGAFAAKDKDAMKIALGGAFIYSREEEGELKVQTPTATGGLRGTQLVVRVLPGGRTLMKVLEGELDLSNAQGRVLLKAGEAGEADHGRAPRKTAVIETRNLLQWALYYPAVLQPEELGLSAAEQQAVRASLAAYRVGDLLGALAAYPRGTTPSTSGARLYRAAVLLATGQVEEARKAMSGVPAGHTGRRAMERMLAAVLFVEQPDAGAATSAGAAMAESYYRQSRSELEKARAAARLATELAPESGFTWTRLAELEFSFGRTRAARKALERGLKLTPRNAQAHALRGYLLSAENEITAARASFEYAVALDGGLGNAWLGLGLTKTKQGHRAEGRADLQTAATVEPTRSFFYSYHGKALSMEGNGKLARKDLDLARLLDPHDPTPWLYSAVQNQQENRPNTAIDDLTESLRLNDNRRVYRSQFLLDQDRAVRSANLAKIYQNAGMTDLAVREATRAVESDYTNASAHLFLANSFDALRDPERISLRYETVWFNELLLAHLLAPVGGGALSQFVSQQEYSKLLEADGIGGSLTGEWRDNGQFEQRVSAFATRGKLSLGVDLSYRYDNGERPNNASSSEEIYWQLKYQVTADDIFYTLGKWQDQETGDLFQSYSNQPGSLGLDFEEKQEPGLLLGGWNHRWAPGVNTLVLGGRLAAEQRLTAPTSNQLLLAREPNPPLDRVLAAQALGSVVQNPDGSLTFSRDLRRAVAPYLGRGTVSAFSVEPFRFATLRQFEIYTGEVQHIWDTKHNTLILGGRWQSGEFETDTLLSLVDPAGVAAYSSPAARQHVNVDFERQSLYAYDFFKPAPWVTLIAGVSWDRIEHPENFRNPPVSERGVANERVNGKFGFTLSPSRWFTVRGVYTEGLGGVTFDESVRLEPTQIAGFNQAFRTVISEDIAGSVESPVYKNWGLSIEGALPTRTWWGASFNILEEDVDRTVGAFDVLRGAVFPDNAAALPAGTTQQLAYREEVLGLGLNQLIGREFAVGATYRHTRAELRNIFAQVPVAIAAGADRFDEAVLHELSFYANWNSPTGWFARAEMNYYAQDLGAAEAGLRVDSPAGDDFWQANAQVGYRFHRNLCEVSAGVLNITDRDYNLSPLTYLRELPHERTFFIRYRLSF